LPAARETACERSLFIALEDCMYGHVIQAPADAH
jgi:hypothetical protein